MFKINTLRLKRQQPLVGVVLTGSGRINELALLFSNNRWLDLPSNKHCPSACFHISVQTTYLPREK